MSRTAAMMLAVVALTLSATVTLEAQRGGGRGGMGGGARGSMGGGGRGGFHAGGSPRAMPVPASPVPAFSGRPVVPPAGRVVVPPVVSPVTRTFFNVPGIGAGRPIHRAFAQQRSFGAGFYSPYIWNWSSPFYSAPYGA